MSAAFVLILVVAGAYLAAYVAFEWLARHFQIISGAEYLLLGILLGPQVSGLISPSVVGDFAPFMTLALGWIGVMVGTQFYLPGLFRISAKSYRIAFIEAVFALVVVAAAMAGALAWLFSRPLVDVLLPAVALGAIATASMPSGIALVSRTLGRSAPVLRQLELTTAVDALVGITAFGLLLSIVHVVPDVTPRAPTATEWAVISIGIGVVSGSLFHLFLGSEKNIDRLFIGLGGAIILASGAAAYLRLSPLLPAMLIGMILINTSANRNEIKTVLTRVERPLYFVLLIFAGAAWDPGGWVWVIPTVIFLAVRIAAKLGGSWLAAWSTNSLPVLGKGWGQALLGHGGLAVAIALNYQTHDQMPLANVVFTATIASVLLTSISSAKLVEAAVKPFWRVRIRRVTTTPVQTARNRTANPELAAEGGTAQDTAAQGAATRGTSAQGTSAHDAAPRKKGAMAEGNAARAGTAQGGALRDPDHRTSPGEARSPDTNDTSAMARGPVTNNMADDVTTRRSTAGEG
jgi:hypothetical protein